MPTRSLVSLSFAFLSACSTPPCDSCADASSVDAHRSDADLDATSETPDGATERDASSDGGASSAGFVAEPGFVVTGSFVDGEEIVIRRTSGGLGERELPWLFDVVTHQYLVGVDQHAYEGLATGAPITDDVWTDLGIYSGWDPIEHRFHYTIDAARLRYPTAGAQYGNYARDASDPRPYSKLAAPAWPETWGEQRNEQMYLSWWQRVTGTHPGYPSDDAGNGGEDKPLRFGDTFGRGLGVSDLTIAGMTSNTVGFGNVKAWGSFDDPGGEWHRIEVFIDRTRGILDLHTNGALGIGTYSGVGGDFEFRPADQYLYVTPRREGTALDSGEWENVTVHWLGFDDGGTTQMFAPGRNVEISEVYLDVTRARFELSTADAWLDSPDEERTSEVQGRVLDWSDDEVRVELHRGAFESLDGLALFFIDENGRGTLVGRFADE